MLPSARQVCAREPYMQISFNRHWQSIGILICKTMPNELLLASSGHELPSEGLIAITLRMICDIQKCSPQSFFLSPWWCDRQKRAAPPLRNTEQNVYWLFGSSLWNVKSTQISKCHSFMCCVFPQCFVWNLLRHIAELNKQKGKEKKWKIKLTKKHFWSVVFEWHVKWWINQQFPLIIF